MTVYRILVRHGLVTPVNRKRGRKDFVRWQREEPMQLWQMDIVGDVLLPSGKEAKVVACVDDHSLFVVAAKGCAPGHRPGRAVCTALAESATDT